MAAQTSPPHASASQADALTCPPIASGTTDAGAETCGGEVVARYRFHRADGCSAIVAWCRATGRKVIREPLTLGTFRGKKWITRECNRRRLDKLAARAEMGWAA